MASSRVLSKFFIPVASIDLCAWLIHSALPPSLLISSRVSPIRTIPVLSILGSIATVLYTNLCVSGEASKRMMKWWPESCFIACFLTGLVRRYGPQFVMPRTTPPEARTREPAVRAILYRYSFDQMRSVTSIREWIEVLFYFRDVARPDLRWIIDAWTRNC